MKLEEIFFNIINLLEDFFIHNEKINFLKKHLRFSRHFKAHSIVSSFPSGTIVHVCSTRGFIFRELGFTNRNAKVLY